MISSMFWVAKTFLLSDSVVSAMGSSEIWNKYHECCVGNLPFPQRRAFIQSFIATHATPS